ncbi:hypothetical protein [Pelomonas sp. KK5]|uniref:hypothetical protein n=1 Tax=Pelomonas sp. KK5 TaxID=1855730 RepID=UPI00097BB174|nr:hypothetical protein [Pelomonas sp. KK5]
MTTSDQKPSKPSIEEIFQLLRRGMGHEHVDLGNVDELLQMAQLHDYQVLAQELREYKADC